MLTYSLVQFEGSADGLVHFCAGELAAGDRWSSGLSIRLTDEWHTTQVVGIEERDSIPNALLLLDQAEAAPVLAACNAQLEFGEPHASHITADLTVQADMDGAVSIRKLVPTLPEPAALDLRRRRRIRAAFPSRDERYPVQRLEQAGQRDIQRMADICQCLDRGIRDAALDGRDIRPVNVCLEGQRLLRLVDLVPALLDAPAERHRYRCGRADSRGGASGSHGRQDARMTTDSRRYKLFNF